MAVYTHNEIAVPSGIAWHNIFIDGDNPLSSTDTLIVLANSDGTETRIIGSGFTFAGGVPTAGTITQIDRTTSGGGTVYETVTGLSLSLVTLFTSGTDTDPGGPNATPFALIFAGVDTFNGWTGNDTFTGGAGGDTFNGGGGAGTNFVSYFNSTVGLVADINNPANNTGDAAGDVYNGITGLIGSDFNDTLRGAATNDVLVGGLGNDFLRGRGGADTLDGGAGTDYADYGGTGSTSVTVSLANTAVNTGAAIGDVFISIEGLSGSVQNDTLIGDGGLNFLRGNAGADSLDGGGGLDYADYGNAAAGIVVNLSNTALNTGDAIGDTYTSIEGIRGSDFNDTLTGDANNNFLRGDEGGDSLDGGAGNDYADYRGAAVGVVANLANSALNTGDAAGDTYVSIENIQGSSFNDTLVGDGGTNFLRGGLGADSLDGGTGFDYAEYFNASEGVSASLAAPGSNTGEAAGDTYTSIEALSGSSFNDTLIGDGLGNNLRGGLGADFLSGGGGTDFAEYRGATAGVVANLGNAGLNTGEAAGDSYVSIEGLIGSNFNDTLTGDDSTISNFLRGGLGADVLDGGNSPTNTTIDYADYNGASTGLQASLANPGSNTGEAAGDTYIGIRGLIGTNFNDTLIGNSTVNFLDGRGGADVFDGGEGNDWVMYSSAPSGLTVSLANPGLNTGVAAGDTYTSIENLMGSGFSDTLIGDGGNNFIRGLGGADSMDGGGGSDWADYNNETVGLVANLGNSLLNTGNATGDTYTSIENLRGGSGNDTLVGDGNDNILRGMGGGDSLVGGGGNDWADYRTVDTALSGSVVANLANPGLNTGDAAGDTYDSIANLIGSEFNDTLVGDGNDNILAGGGGADNLSGGGGIDTASYRFASAAVRADLQAPGTNFGEAFGDAYSSIENLTGGVFNDTLIGDGTDNVLTGNQGDDSLEGGAGSDSLIGGLGNDTYVVDSYGDVITELSGEGIDTIQTGLNFALGANIERLTLTGGGDLIGIGNELANILTGNTGGNPLVGLGGADQLIGGDGSDSLYFDNLDTVVNGGAGFDYAIVLEPTGGVTLDLGANGIEVAAGGSFGDVFDASTATWSTTIVGLGGADQLTGGSQSDALYFDHLDTVIVGGGGTDLAIAYQSGAITLNLTDGMSLELVAGSDNADTFNASALSYGVTLVGLGGADTMTGSAFADAIYFDNLDTVTGGAGYDWAYAINSGAVNLNLGATGFEGATGSAFADTFDASGVTDPAGAQIFAGAGDDMIFNSAFADLFVGEADFDTVVYTGIAQASANIGNAGGGTFIITIGGVSDVLVGIEKLTFSDGDFLL